MGFIYSLKVCSNLYIKPSSGLLEGIILITMLMSFFYSFRISISSLVHFNNISLQNLLTFFYLYYSLIILKSLTFAIAMSIELLQTIWDLSLIF